ncbi:hypothetical protein [Yoonia sp.]|uniref:hypothetical protein n=1 Tax=Yoonia sp. TaxID=2212373 RepID=UPI0035C84591
MTMMNPNEEMLDAVFAQARGADTTPGDDVTARILADAATVQSGFGASAAPEKTGLWARMLDALGGWPAVSGLTAATVAGIWVGVAPPMAIEDLTASVIGDEVSVSFYASDLGFETEVLIDG